MRLPLAIALLLVGACKTTQPKDDTPILVETTGATVVTEPGTVGPAGPAAAGGERPSPAPSPAILVEPLQPVRGGARLLPPYRGPDPCKMALAGESPVAQACSAGGTRKAVEMMQTFVRRAAAEGIVFQCVDCHPDEDDLSKLAPSADAEFRKLLFLARPEN